MFGGECLYDQDCCRGVLFWASRKVFMGWPYKAMKVVSGAGAGKMWSAVCFSRRLNLTACMPWQPSGASVFFEVFLWQWMQCGAAATDAMAAQWQKSVKLTLNDTSITNAFHCMELSFDITVRS